MIENNNTLRISISDKCNFHCVYCPDHMEVFEPKLGLKTPLTDEELLDIVKLSVSLWITKVSLTWGEPLIKKDIWKFCKELKRYSWIKRLEMTTNAFLLDKFLDDENSKYVDFFKISFDSNKKETFNKMVWLPAYDKVLQNIKRLIWDDRAAVLNVVLSKENIRELDDIIAFAESLWIDLSLLDAVCHNGNKDWWKNNYYDFDNLKWILEKKYKLITNSDDASPEVSRRLNRIWMKKSTGISFPYYDTWKIYIRLKDSKNGTRRDLICKKCPHFCQEWLCMLRLTINGWITCCQSVSKDNWFQINEYTQEQQIKIIDFLQKRFNNSIKDKTAFSHFKEIMFD